MLKEPQFDAALLAWIDEHASRGYITTDTSLIIRGWNRWLEEKAGLRAEDVIGRPLMEVLPELVCRQLDKLYRNALNGQVAVLANRFHKYLIKLPARPEYGLCEMQQSAFIGPLQQDGNVVGTITMIDDVTDRVFRENELLAAREEADKANEAKDRFIAVLSHDLRTPLSAIHAWSRILKEHPTNEQMIRKGVEVIERNVAIQIDLIEQILDISRINASTLQLEIDSVDVREMIGSILESIEPIAESKGIRIETALIEERRIASLDPKRFQQIIWNLISNALKFTPEGGTVRVALEYAADGFQVTVADTGKGISAESMPHLFKPLWQAEGSSGYGGLGLGLAIVQNLVELHGGTIRADSPGPGQGAVFTVQIPWSASKQTERPALTTATHKHFGAS